MQRTPVSRQGYAILVYDSSIFDALVEGSEGRSSFLKKRSKKLLLLWLEAAG
jgi:hypothetical protein